MNNINIERLNNWINKMTSNVSVDVRIPNLELCHDYKFKTASYGRNCDPKDRFTTWEDVIHMTSTK